MNRVLIIDDDKELCALMKKCVEQENLSTISAHGGIEGLRLVYENRKACSLIILDVMMPEMNGIEVVRKMESMGLLKQIPVFLITAEANDKVVKEAYQLGVMDVIKKPYVSFVVMRRVESVIELFETRRHLNLVVEKQQVKLLEQAKQIIELNQGMIEALATAIEFRNEESGGHVQRISEITRLMLENTSIGKGLAQDEIDDIALASIMHDVGKITIPDSILTKPGRLTPDEYEVMKTHTTKGVVILESIPQLHDSRIFDYACDIALHHHERWDGRGYPEGLEGSSISPWAQVVSLADVYDALSCKRVYKASYSRDMVIEMIGTGQCGSFNPRLLDSFFSIEDQLSQMYQSIPEAQNF